MIHFKDELNEYLSATFFINCDNRNIIDYAHDNINQDSSNMEKAIGLYYAVRDDIFYDPYGIDLTPERMKASYTLEIKKGYCVAKAILMAAVCRAVGIPSRLGFADVKNHLTTEALKEAMKSDIFVYHGYTELFLNDKWVKATPAFNLSLCEKFNIKPLEFDGEHDSVFHAFDAKGNKHMEYIVDHGTYADLPIDEIGDSYKKHYPEAYKETTITLKGDFEDEAKPL